MSLLILVERPNADYLAQGWIIEEFDAQQLDISYHLCARREPPAPKRHTPGISFEQAAQQGKRYSLSAVGPRTHVPTPQRCCVRINSW